MDKISLTEYGTCGKIFNCNPLSQGSKRLIEFNYLGLRISEYTNKGGAF